MGMDVYGINPKDVVGTEPKFPENYRELSEAAQDEYWEADRKFHKDNPGIYFRANAWGWRPIHIFMSQACSHIYGEKIDSSMQFNDGAGIPEELIEECADAMQKSLDSLKEDYPEDIVTVDTEDGPVDCYAPIHDDEWRDSYTVPLWRLKDWIKFVRNSGGFRVH